MNVLQNFARWYFSRRALPYWAILLLDSLIVMANTVADFQKQREDELRHGICAVGRHIANGNIPLGSSIADNRNYAGGIPVDHVALYPSYIQ